MKFAIGALPMVAVCALLVPTACLARGEHYASWKAFEVAHPARVGPGQRIPSFDGDLNGDGVKDKVVMLYLPDHDHSQIFVLTGDPSGGFDVTGESDAFEYGTGGAGYSWVQPLKKYATNAFAVTFVTDDNAISSCSYKFRLRGKIWRLAGEDCDSEGEGDNLYEWQSSVDFLTGRYTSHLSDGHGKLKTRHGRHHFPVLTLRDFKYGDDYGLNDLWVDVP